MSSLRDGFYDIDGQPDEIYHNNKHLESVFQAFICPLTRELMKDPVVLENGLTFERVAIEKWLNECRNNGKKNLCPLSLKELGSDYLTPNIALTNTIEEWKQRNEAAKLNLAHLALGRGSPDKDVLDALIYIQEICTENRYQKHHVRDQNLIPRIIERLMSNSRSIRCQALETLLVVVQDDDDNKEVVAIGNNIRTVVKFLVQDFPKERYAAVSLLSELSKSELLLEKIGEVNGAILILVGMASSKTEDDSTVQKAQEILENLGKCEKNVLQMAENGIIQPLLTLLLEGSPETQLSMTSYLGELVLSKDLKVLVANSAGSFLVNLMVTGSKEKKVTAVKALNQISSSAASAKQLIDVGILPPLIGDLLATSSKELPVGLRETLASILANIVTNCADSISISLDQDHKTLTSEETIHDILHLISNTGPAFGRKLLQILVGLSSTRTTAESIFVAIKSSGAAINVLQFMDAPQGDLQKVVLKLLHNISPYMDEEHISLLCNSTGCFSKLIDIISEMNMVSEEQVDAIGILVEIPDKDGRLTQCLLHERGFDAVVRQIRRIRQGETLGNRVVPYLEGLCRVLLKLVYNNLEDALPFIREKNLAALFTEMIHTNVNDNVIIISAKALEKLSRLSKHLVRTISLDNSASRRGKKKPVTTSFCTVHRGFCTMKENFCLIEGKAVERLASCLDHVNNKVVGAALSALCTLLMDGVDIEQGMLALSNADAIKPIMQMLKNSKVEMLQQKSIWAVERMLRAQDIANLASVDPNLDIALKQAYQHGDAQTRLIAEKALKHINKIPKFSFAFPTG